MGTRTRQSVTWSLRSRFGSVSLAVCSLLAFGAAADQQRAARIEFRPMSSEAVERELARADRAFHVVDSLFGGPLPARVLVDLSGTGAATFSDSTITLDPAYGAELIPQLTRQLSRMALRRLLGDAVERVEHGFLFDGLTEWAVAHVARDPEQSRWHETWAAYGYREEATYLEFLADYERAREELGPAVLAGVGHSFVALLVDRHGLAGLHDVLHALPSATELCAALDRAGPGCRRALAAWEAKLEASMEGHDFSLLPQVRADLYTTALDDGRYELELGVWIDHPEGGAFDYVIETVVRGSEHEQAFEAEGTQLESRVSLGRVEPGSHVIWRVAVWSSRFRLWRHTGWQSRTID